MQRDRNDFPKPDTWFALHVSYGETDCAGVVYYGNYFHWFERARGQLIREQGMSYATIQERGILLPVRNAACRYIRPARYDDPVLVRAAISAWGRASVTFTYQVWGPPDHVTLLAVGETEHACTGPDGRPVRVPDWLSSLFLAPEA